MEETLKKTFKIFLVLLVINIILAIPISFIIGDTSILRFVKVDNNSYEIHGILTTSFFLIFTWIIYITLYVLNPLWFNLLAKNIPAYYRATKLFSFIYGTKAIEDIERDPKLYMKKTISSFIILFWIGIIFFNLFLIGGVRNMFSSSPFIPALMFIGIVISFFVFIHLIYKLL